MRKHTKRFVSLVSAIALLITCGISGLVLPAAAETAANLFPNGDFEGFGETTPVYAPWAAYEASKNPTTVIVKKGVGVDGSWGMQTGTGTGSAYATFTDAPKFTYGKTYRLSFMAKGATVAGTNNTTGAYVQVYKPNQGATTGATYLNATTNTIRLRPGKTVDEWITYVMYFTPTDADITWDKSYSLLTARPAAETGTITYDNFVLEEVTDATEYLPGGDFEKGFARPFYEMINDGKAEVTTKATTANDKNKALKLTATDAGWDSGWLKNTHLEKNATYKIAFDYIGGAFRAATNSSYGSIAGGTSVSFDAVDEWTAASYELTFTGDQNWAINFEKRKSYDHNVADTYIDNFSITKVVKAPAATGIALDKTTAELEVGDELTLNVTATPDGAAVPSVAWTTSDDTVATVENGKVTAVKAGTATITATAEGLTSVTCVVTVKEKAPADGNLLTNGDFEQGGTDWGTDDAATIGAGLGKNGSNGLKITTTVNAGDGAAYPGIYFKGTFVGLLEANTTYIFSFDYKHEGKGWGDIDVIKAGSDWTGNWGDITSLTATDWTTYTVEFTTGSADNITAATSTGWEWKVRHVQYDNAANNNGSGTVWFDNFRLEKKAVVAATGIALDKTTAELEVGDELTLNVTATPDGAAVPSVAWTTSDDTVATVENGKVAAVKAGTATITATAEGLTSVTCVVTVNAAVVDTNLFPNGNFEGFGKATPVTKPWTANASKVKNAIGVDDSWGLEVNDDTTVYPDFGAALTLEEGATYRLSFQVKGVSVSGVSYVGFATTNGLTYCDGSSNRMYLTPADTTNTWATYKTEFVAGANASIDDNYGIAIKRHQSETGALIFDNFVLEKIADPIPATAIELDKTTAELMVGDELTLNVTATPDGAVMPNIVWTTSDDAVAAVENGKVTAVKAGTATITATAEGLTSVTCTVTVKDPMPATAIALDKTTATIKVGTTVLVSVITTPVNADKPTVVWASSDDAVAMVADGVVTGVKAGTATITATVDGLTPATCVVTVEEPVNDGNLLTNGDFELGDTGWNKDNASVTIAHGNGRDESLGIKIETTVNEGEAAKQPGAYYAGEFNGLLEPDTTYVFSFDYKHEGKGFPQIDVVYGGTDWIGWTDTTLSSNVDWTTKTIVFTTGAAENMNVKVGYEWKARHMHYANAANCGSGTAWFDNFKLVKMPTATAVHLDKESVTVQEGKTFTLSVSSTPEAATIPTITWKSDDESIATVADGVITGVAVGTTTITATAEGLTPVTCTVTVEEGDGNLIVNGDFEQGTVSWGGDDAQRDRVQEGGGKDGSIGFVGTTTVDENTTAHQYAGIYYQGEFITLLEPDTIYAFSVDVKHTGEGFAQIYFNKNLGKQENGVALSGGMTLASGNTDWTTVTYTFSTDSVLPEANPRFEWQVRQIQYKDKVGEGTTYLDNFKLVEVGKVVFADEIKLSPEVLDILPYDTSALAVTTVPANVAVGVITWESSDPSVVSVDDKGNVVALKETGSVTITATSNKGKTATATVNITEYGNIIKNGNFEQGASVSWGNISAVKPGIGKDGSFGLELTHDPESGNGWTSYYYKGSFVGLMEPATTYEFSFDYYAPSKTSDIRFWSGKMKLAAGKIEMGVDAWQTATATFTTPTDLTFNTGWDMSIVCDATGSSPIVLDNLVIKKYTSGIQADTVTLSQNTLTLIPGRTGALTMHAQPVEADLNDIVWTSSDENVATVEYGVVTGVGKGTAIITGTTKNNKSATCKVTVNGNDLLIYNGSFDVDGQADKWQFTGDAEIAVGEGRVKSDAAMLKKNGTFSQTFTGLKANTDYQLLFRYRSTKGQFNVKMTNGDQTIVDQTLSTKSLWTSYVYEFTTPETLDENTVLTFTGLGYGPMYIDNIVLAVKASLIDFVVQDIIWDGGGHQVVPGTELLFAVTVVNQGEDPVDIGETIYVDLCKNGETFMTLEHVCESELETNGTIIIIAKEKWKAVEGDHVISARANPQLSILELDDSNNAYQVHLRVNEDILEPPQPAKDAGMDELTFVDEFDSTDSIDMYATGKDGYKWYVTRQWNAGTVTPNDYTVKDGIISLHDNNPVFNITLSTMDINTGNGWKYNLGYLETKLRIVEPNRHEYMPGMSGGIPAIWSFAYQKWLNDSSYKHHVEMDWLEYWGRDLERWPTRPDGYYTVTFHDMLAREGQDDRWWSNSNSYCNGLGDGEWHIMGWLWVQDAVIAYIDGEEVFRIQYDENGEPSCKVNNHSELTFDFTGAFSQCNVQEVVLYIAGAYDKPLELDYVHIWQGGTGSIDLPEIGDEDDGDEDDNDGNIIVDIPADEFWYNYCTDDWGDNIVEVTYDNYLNVLGEEMGDGTYEAQYYWSKLSDERKAEINALLAANGQPTFDKLLAAALEMAEKVANGWTPPTNDGDSGEIGDGDSGEIGDGDSGEIGDGDSGEVGDGDSGEVGDGDSDEAGDDESGNLGDDESCKPDDGEPEGNQPEDNAPTGATTALPTVLAMVMLLSAAVLWFVRKRERA